MLTVQPTMELSCFVATKKCIHQMAMSTQYFTNDSISPIEAPVQSRQLSPQLFLQPMGGNASPLIADLYLSWLEYQYLSKLVTNKDFNLLHKLKYYSHYINDIITPNVENFLEIATHIYPTEISLQIVTVYMIPFFI